MMTMIRFLLFLLAHLIVTHSESGADDAPSVETKLGIIIGKYKDVSAFGKHMKVEQYHGIPYAEPPVGKLRFMKSVPKKPFTFPFRALQHGNTCFQLLNIIPTDVSRLSEDCLNLNLHVPAERKGDLPVMIFIHGGGFVAGSKDTALSDTLAAYGQVIVVTINYRLSLFGFLSTGDEHARGNYGLWDQHLAIKWVHDNIQAFGGDPKKVTIFGESAGAISVAVQSLYEGNKGLFQNAIAQSGSITFRTICLGDPKKEAEKLGKLVGCEFEDSESLVNCLKVLPDSVLNETFNDVTNGFLGFPMPFVPTIDGEFIKEHPKDILNRDIGKSSAGREFFSTINFLSGINAAEGIVMMGPLLGMIDLETFKLDRTFYEENLIPMVLPAVTGPVSPDAIKKMVIHEYTDWSDPEDNERRLHKFVALFSDIFFAETLLETVARHDELSEDHGRTYMYMFDIDPSFHVLPAPSWLTRAIHGDELQYIFFEESGELMRFLPGRDGYVPMDWEHDVAKYMIDLWCNFAKTGNPNKPTPVQMFWPEYSKENQQYLHITREMTSDSVKSHLLAREFNLWNKLIPSIMRALSRTPSKDSKDTEYCEKDGHCPP